MTTTEKFIELENMQTSIFAVASCSNTKDFHVHRVGQLSAPQNGTMYVVVNGQMYIVPPNKAIFIPKNTEHGIYKVNEHIFIENIYFTDEHLHSLPKSVSLINLSALAKALLAKLCKIPADQLNTEKMTQMINIFLSDLTDECNEIAYIIKTPQTDKLKKVFNMLTTSVDYLPNMNDSAKIINVSSRTLQRMIKNELHISFIQWRQQIVFAKAIELLNKYRKTSLVAYKLGYNSESAFIAMFKKMSSGKLPSQF